MMAEKGWEFRLLLRKKHLISLHSIQLHCHSYLVISLRSILLVWLIHSEHIKMMIKKALEQRSSNTSFVISSFYCSNTLLCLFSSPSFVIVPMNQHWISSSNTTDQPCHLIVHFSIHNKRFKRDIQSLIIHRITTHRSSMTNDLSLIIITHLFQLLSPLLPNWINHSHSSLLSRSPI